MSKIKALFLDRDGIINVDHGYVSSPDKFDFSEGIFTLLRLFQKEGYSLFIVTNQSGIGRGYYSKEAFLHLTQWMLKKFKNEDITIEHVFYCPHAPEANCHCRKPHTAMIKKILKDDTFDFSSSWMIGDKQSDIDFARNANISNTIAIGQRYITKMSYHFNSILECLDFLEENTDIIST